MAPGDNPSSAALAVLMIVWWQMQPRLVSDVRADWSWRLEAGGSGGNEKKGGTAFVAWLRSSVQKTEVSIRYLSLGSLWHIMGDGIGTRYSVVWTVCRVDSNDERTDGIPVSQGSGRQRG